MAHPAVAVDTLGEGAIQSAGLSTGAAVVRLLWWVDQVIDRAVAVIIGGVADLGGGFAGGPRAGVVEPIVRAAQTAGAGAGPDTYDTGLSQASVALVRRSVAIVIGPIAELFALFFGLQADPLTIYALSHTLAADALALGSAGHAPVGKGLVDATIAVVILAVADLGLGLENRSASQDGLGAEERAQATGADLVGFAVCAHLGNVLVRTSVTIVVQAIAGLDFDGRDDGGADPIAGRAGPLAVTAEAGPSRCTGVALLTAHVVIHETVAIIVQVIAGLGRGADSALTD